MSGDHAGRPRQRLGTILNSARLWERNNKSVPIAGSLAKRVGFLSAAFAVLLCLAGSAVGESLEIRVEPHAAAIGSLSLGGNAVPLSSTGGGFTAYDATRKQSIGFSNGVVRAAEDKIVFDGQSDENGIIRGPIIREGEEYTIVF